jgi:hypothetical protein
VRVAEPLGNNEVVGYSEVGYQLVQLIEGSAKSEPDGAIEEAEDRCEGSLVWGIMLYKGEYAQAQVDCRGGTNNGQCGVCHDIVCSINIFKKTSKEQKNGDMKQANDDAGNGC